MPPESGEPVRISGDVRIGSQLADYRIEALLGRGGMSDVYQAEDLRLRRRVALKILTPELASDAHFRERFLRESELAASIDHPNIIPIYEAGETAGCLFIAMRYVEGTDLKALLRAEGALESGRALAIIAQVADALDAAHEHGLVHRDVKPSNVLIDPRGHCYLSDFGLTQTIADRGDASENGQIVGTVDYAAPEQLRSLPLDGRADIYALGCMLFECLTGEVPFPHDSEVAVIYAQLEESPPKASERRPRLPAAVDAPLEQAMAKLPAERPASARALVEAAEAGLGVQAERGAAHSRRGLAAGLVVAVFAIAGVGSWLFTRGDTGVSVPPGSDALVRIDPKTNAAGAAKPVGHDATAVAVGSHAVWVANHGDDSVSRLDIATGKMGTIPVKGTPIDIAAGGDVVNVVNGPSNNSVVTIDGQTGRTGEITVLPSDQFYAPLVAGGGGKFWLAESEAHTVSSADTGGQFLVLGTTIEIPPDPASMLTEYVSFDGLAVGEGAVWVAGDYYGRTVWRVDPVSEAVTSIRLPFIPAGIAAGEGAVWVTSLLDDSVARIDPATRRIVARIPVGRGASALAVGHGAVWVADSLDDAVSRIDPRDDSVTTIPVGLAPVDIAAAADGAWVIGRQT